MDLERLILPDVPRLPYGPGWLLVGVGTVRGMRGRGYADEMMKEVLFDADRDRAVLYLSVDPDPDTDYDRLTAWYKRLGFEHILEEDPNAMARLPYGWKPGCDK